MWSRREFGLGAAVVGLTGVGAMRWFGRGAQAEAEPAETFEITYTEALAISVEPASS